MEIFRRLPKTNCGKCGLPTCMAFAMKVKIAQTNLSSCPYLKDDSPSESEGRLPGSPRDGYADVASEIEKEAAGLDFERAAAAVGGSYISGGGKEAVILKMINKSYRLEKEGLFENDERSGDAWAKIIIGDYVRRQSTAAPTGEWIGLGHFPNTASHVKAFQRNAEEKIAAAFKEDPDGVRRRCGDLGGMPAPNTLNADYNCRFDLLPKVPLVLFLWSADEEFGADCKLLFDSGAEAHIDIEYLANLVERFTLELAGE